MSINDTVVFKASNGSETQNIGLSVARSLYVPGQTVLISGELGAGKTTFVQGLARGLGILEQVTSPTYALEQRYGDGILSHIDLYRLNEKQAVEFLRALDAFPGVRIIEWPERAEVPEATMTVTIREVPDGRGIGIDCRDIAIPSDRQIDSWVREVMLPPHIVAHMSAVASAAEKVADSLLAQKRFVRPKALRAAALTHDLLRFVDFKSLTGDGNYTPTEDQSAHWQKLKDRYGTPHETAASTFLAEHGFKEIGVIVSAHRGLAKGGESMVKTIEQAALAYGDKRAAFDKPVTLDERFDDFLKRYGDGKESEYAKSWRAEMKRIEAELFPDGAVF